MRAPACSSRARALGRARPAIEAGGGSPWPAPLARQVQGGSRAPTRDLGLLLRLSQLAQARRGGHVDPQAGVLGVLPHRRPPPPARRHRRLLVVAGVAAGAAPVLVHQRATVAGLLVAAGLALVVAACRCRRRARGVRPQEVGQGAAAHLAPQLLQRLLVTAKQLGLQLRLLRGRGRSERVGQGAGSTGSECMWRPAALQACPWLTRSSRAALSRAFLRPGSAIAAARLLELCKVRLPALPPLLMVAANVSCNMHVLHGPEEAAMGECRTRWQ